RLIRSEPFLRAILCSGETRGNEHGARPRRRHDDPAGDAGRRRGAPAARRARRVGSPPRRRPPRRGGRRALGGRRPRDGPGDLRSLPPDAAGAAAASPQAREPRTCIRPRRPPARAARAPRITTVRPYGRAPRAARDAAGGPALVLAGRRAAPRGL